MKVKSETVYATHTDVVRATKDTGSFGGPNMWNLEIKTPSGFYERAQWMHVNNVERYLGVSLTRYLEPRD